LTTNHKQLHHRYPVAAQVALRHFPGLFAVLETDDGVGHHDVVVLELADRVRFDIGELLSEMGDISTGTPLDWFPLSGIGAH
jgi:hypothetical protein